MNTDELEERQNRLLEDYDNAKATLLPLDNVVAVGIGLKETNGEFTEEISYRVFVTEKKDLSELNPSQLVPKVIDGVKTDVITVYRLRDLVFTEMEDDSEHRPIKSGIALNNENFRKESGSFGTLGWFGTLADGTNIVLTNKHVIYDSTAGTDNSVLKLTQPYYDKSCCCECGVIGETIIGIKNDTVDCGIAKINTDINRNLVINNKKTTEMLRVSNTTTAVAVVGETVRKIGARSAFTRGKVVHIGDIAAAPLDSGGTAIVIRPDQVLIVPADDETYEFENGKKSFANAGDSGSVVLNTANQIVALLWGVDSDTNTVIIAVANKIANVLAALSTEGFSITLTPSPPGGGIRRAQRLNSRPITINKLLSVNAEFIQDHENHRLLKLVNIHRSEVNSLINNCRPVKVAWHRFHGPAFAAHFLNSAKDPSYKFPKEVKGVSFQTLLINMGEVLRKHGSESLREDIEMYGFEVMALAEKSGSVHELIEKISADAPSKV